MSVCQCKDGSRPAEWREEIFMELAITNDLLRIYSSQYLVACQYQNVVFDN